MCYCVQLCRPSHDYNCSRIFLKGFSVTCIKTKIWHQIKVHWGSLTIILNIPKMCLNHLNGSRAGALLWKCPNYFYNNVFYFHLYVSLPFLVLSGKQLWEEVERDAEMADKEKWKENMEKVALQTKPNWKPSLTSPFKGEPGATVS